MKKATHTHSVIDKNWVLVLAANIWQPIGYTSIRKALKAMFSEDADAVQALDLTYPTDENGFVNFKAMPEAIPTGINEWLKLPLRDYDVPIRSTNSTYRAPIVVLTHNCKKMLYRELRPTRKNIWEFYGKRDIWTGKEISFSECTREHMKLKSQGGDDSWLNIAPASKKLNHERGATPLEKWKYKPQFKLVEPPKAAVSTFIKTAVRPEWEYFIIR